MIRSIQQILGSPVQAIDGPIGDVHDIYFDDHEWVVRYFVVDTGHWLPGRKVLISQQAVGPTAPGKSVLPVDLTRDQVRNSPDMETKRPISRQAEFVLYRYYGWMPYWLPLAPPSPVVVEGNAAEREREAEAGHYGGDPHLRSAAEAIGYHVAATDGQIGHIDDFLLDENAKMRYAVVDTRNWLPGKKVLIATDWITDVKWSDSKVFVKVQRSAVKDSPAYDPDVSVDSGYESRLFEHYGYPVPWR